MHEGTSRWTAPGRIVLEATSALSDVIASLGRTEDVRLSPDDRCLAIVGYAANRIHLFGIDIDLASSSPPKVRLHDHRVLASPALADPHGVTFLGNEHILVCNRGADVCIFRIPPAGRGGPQLTVTPHQVIRGRGFVFARVKNPGSADAYPMADGGYRVLICNNHWNFVSSHVARPGVNTRIRHQGNLLDPRIRIPDGISISPDGAWVAISNHMDGEVLIYRNTERFSSDASPAAALKGIVCPHGIRFTPDGHVLVADAASQYLHVFAHEGSWSGDHSPRKSIRMMEDDRFYDGRYATREGGLKGIDVDRSGRVLITTHARDPLAFYDLHELLDAPGETPGPEYAEFCRQRDESLDADHRLTLRWTVGQRLRALIQGRRRRWWNLQERRRIQAEMRMLQNRVDSSRDSLLDPGGPVVCLTTHESRISLVQYAIETIGRGRQKPSRLILWLTDEETFSRRPAALKRLEARGLEVLPAEEHGPHSKYWPYLESTERFDRPLVTADDDCLYYEDWLQDLVTAWEENPETIHCHRTRRMRLVGDELMPYGSWPFVSDGAPSNLNFITGVGGVIYPPSFLPHLKKQGTAFSRCCPASDDIWLTVQAIRAGFEVAQVRARAYHPVTIPGSQTRSLHSKNVLQGANQVQLRQTFGPDDIRRLRAALEVESGVST